MERRLLLFAFALLGLTFLLICLRVEVRKELRVRYITPSSPSSILRVSCEAVPAVVYTRVPCLRGLPSGVRKRLFVDLLLPEVLIQNFRIMKLRRRLLKLKGEMERGNVSEEDMRWLKAMCRRFKASSVEELLYKVDVIPPGLAIAQAAIETGWGTSRFFCEANNLFGEWDFSKTKEGAVKAKGGRAYLKRFKSVLDSVESYFYNLNAGWAYEGFRLARMRDKSSLTLAKHLERYSVLGREYIDRLERLIELEGLDRYDRCKIDSSYIERSFSVSFCR